MLSSVDVKLTFGILASLLTIIAYIPYVRDILKGSTQPHTYTWLVWFLTTATATAGLWYGGGGYGVISPTISTLLTFFVFVLSFWYGTKNIHRIDTILLITALLAIGAWWLLDNPLLAVGMVTLIDGLGYVPSIRKTFADPSSESVITWVLFSAGIVCAILALAEHNALTLSYLIMSLVGNSMLIGVCVVRRQKLTK